MKRLFQINKPNGKRHGNASDSSVFYADKSAAKKQRDALNVAHSNGGFTVAPGPDHHNYKKGS